MDKSSINDVCKRMMQKTDFVERSREGLAIAKIDCSDIVIGPLPYCKQINYSMNILWSLLYVKVNNNNAISEGRIRQCFRKTIHVCV